MSDSPNSLLVTETRLAACFRALGFPYQADGVIHERTDHLRVQFMFQLQSLRFPALDARELYLGWKSGELKARQPNHVLCVMMLAQHNYDQMLDMQKQGVSLRLESIASGSLTRYTRGQLEGSMMSRERVSTDDLRLAACAGLVGIPVLQIRGNEGGRHVYDLARFGYAVNLDNGRQYVHDAELLLKRAPTAKDALRLALEDTQPLHPLCIGYDALFNRTELKRELEHMKTRLLIDEPTHKLNGGGGVMEILSAKQALVSVDAPGHVMDQVTAHMKSPPIIWQR